MLEHFDDVDSRVRVAVLGSTGSIGRQALDVVRTHPDRFEVVALAAGSDTEGLAAQAKEFDVRLLGLGKGSLSAPEPSVVVEGPDAAAEVAERTNADVVLNAVMGAAGLKATMATITSGKILALANKESLVAAGELVMSRAEPVRSARSTASTPPCGRSWRASRRTRCAGASSRDRAAPSGGATPPASSA